MVLVNWLLPHENNVPLGFASDWFGFCVRLLMCREEAKPTIRIARTRARRQRFFYPIPERTIPMQYSTVLYRPQATTSNIIKKQFVSTYVLYHAYNHCRPSRSKLAILPCTVQYCTVSKFRLVRVKYSEYHKSFSPETQCFHSHDAVAGNLQNSLEDDFRASI